MTSPKFIQIAHSASKSFNYLFTGGSEHRKMMQQEAGAAIVKIMCLCTDISKFVAKHTSCQWSDGIIRISSNLKDDMLVEYTDLLNQWKKNVIVERRLRSPFPRTTIAQTEGYKAAIREEKRLMELVDMYVKLQGNSAVQISHCMTIVEQAAVLGEVLTGMVKASLKISILPNIQVQEATVGLASKEQTSSILNHLQSARKLTSNVIMELGNCSLYVISYDPSSYIGFAFIDAPVHIALDRNSLNSINSINSAKIAYIETLPNHRKTSIATRLLQWIKASAKDSGYKSLYVKSFLPNGNFWMKFGFTLGDSRAICTLDPMCLENLINMA